MRGHSILALICHILTNHQTRKVGRSRVGSLGFKSCVVVVCVCFFFSILCVKVIFLSVAFSILFITTGFRSTYVFTVQSGIDAVRRSLGPNAHTVSVYHQIYIYITYVFLRRSIVRPHKRKTKSILLTTIALVLPPLSLSSHQIYIHDVVDHRNWFPTHI